MKNKNFQYKDYKILGKKEFTPDTFLFRLEGKLDFSPGQFVQVGLPHIGEVTFAPCSNSEEIKYFELCVRASGATTNGIVKLLPNDSMKIRGPYGNGWPLPKLLGKNILIIAGGLGLIPLRPLIFQLLKYRTEFKTIKFVYGAKSDQHLLFSDDLLSWQKKLTFLDACVEHACQGFWGQTGMITKPLEKLNISKNTIILICGPEVMVPYCNEILLKKGVLEKDIYISFERRMECGIGVCQHCNIGKYKVCEDGPVFRLDIIKSELTK